MVARKVTVSHSHGEGFMAHDLLHRPDIDPGHDETARASMAEGVPDHAFDPGFLENRNIGSFVEVLWVNMGQGIQGRKAPGSHDLSFRPDGLQDGYSLIRERNMPGIPMLGPGDGQHPVLEIDVFPSEGKLLFASETCQDGESDQSEIFWCHDLPEAHFFPFGEESEAAPRDSEHFDPIQRIFLDLSRLYGLVDCDSEMTKKMVDRFVAPIALLTETAHQLSDIILGDLTDPLMAP